MPAASWMLDRLDFRPVSDGATLFALDDQARDGRTRTEQAIATLRMAGYEVDAEAFVHQAVPDPTGPLRPVVEPDVAFAEHPWLGIVAATTDTPAAATHGKPVLEANGWRYEEGSDIYVLPIAVDRRTALDRLAQAVTTMHHNDDLRVTLQYALAEAVAVRTTSTARGLAPVDQLPVRTFALDTAARATSPALAGRPPSAASPPAAPAAASLADPRVAAARTR
jgi:hypothetical protein